MAGKETKRRGYHHGDLRRALLDAAFALVEKRGIAELSLREIARRARVSHMAPYAHFHDKDDLVAAMKEQSFRELRDALAGAAAAAGGEPGRVVRGLGEAYVRFALERPAKFQVMFRNPLEPQHRKSSYRFVEAGQEVFAMLVTALRASTGAAPPELERTSLMAWAMIHGLVSLRIDGPLVHIVPGSDEREAFEALIREASERLLRLLGIDSVYKK